MYALKGQAAPRGGAPEGKLLVVPRVRPGAREAIALQPLCVKCGLPASGTLARRFYWHPRWVYLFLLVNLIVYAIAAFAARKRLDVQVPLCAAHRARRRNLILAGWLVAASGVVVPFLLAEAGLGVGPSLFLLVLLVFAGAIMGVIASNPITPIRIDEAGGTFKGCHPAFLRNSVF